MSREDETRIERVARDCIAHKVRLLNRAVTAIYDEALRPHGLTIGQMSMLVTLARMGGANAGALGRELHMEKSTLSRNLQRLRARGWLDAAPTSDARTAALRVTTRGRRLLRDVFPAWGRAQRRAAALLGDQGVRGITRNHALLSQRRHQRQ